jgi:hypothetical protein
MFEVTPLIISITIILAAVIGGLIGRLLSKSTYEDGSGDSKENNEQNFHVDRATGIVSDISSFKC